MTDCDGVIWRGDSILPGIVDFLALLKSMEKNVYFVTNNCMKTREEYVAKFKKFGIEVNRVDDPWIILFFNNVLDSVKFV